MVARFFAGNNLLCRDGTPVTLDGCRALAAREGAASEWDLAARYAGQMVGGLFEPEAPLPPEERLALERLVACLPAEVTRAPDALGWAYQFWQAEKKDEANRRGDKAGARDLPALTQLFTDSYMVDFILQNTLGAWWVGRHGQAPLPAEMPYLRISPDGTPAAGTFAHWPRRAADLRVLDPCCGSGNFLVAAFRLLVRFRVCEEGLTLREACDAVLRENLYGLELDPHCTHLAVVAVMMAAWTSPPEPQWWEVPVPHVACSGLPVRMSRAEWMELVGDRAGMGQLYDLFAAAPVLGSLLDPTALDAGTLPAVARDQAVTVQTLSRKYHLIITNVPYLSREKHGRDLTAFADAHYPEAKHDLATMFLDRLIRLLAPGGTLAAVLPQNWLFLARYKKLRTRLLRQVQWDFLAALGPLAFAEITGEVVKAVLLGLSAVEPEQESSFPGWDVARGPKPPDKAALLETAAPVMLSQHGQLLNPGARVVLGDRGDEKALGHYATVSEGMHTGDYPRFGRKFWELPAITAGWALQQAAPRGTCLYGGREHVIFWEQGAGELMAFVAERLAGRKTSMWIKGHEVWGRRGVAVSVMSRMNATLYDGQLFTHGAMVLVPGNPEHLPALWAFASSPEFHDAVRVLDRKVSVARTSVAHIPFDLHRWLDVARARYPAGLPEPGSVDPTQSVFDGSISGSLHPLQVAVARLLGYRWPGQSRGDGLEKFAADGGIVCLPSVMGEEPAAERLERSLTAAGVTGCTHAALEGWLRDRFFKEHCALFHQTPFIWHIWDGRKDGFAALVNYHQLDHSRLHTLTHGHLADWIRRQEAAGASERLAAATALRSKLVAILEGDAPYDIFVRWKPLGQQAIGWQPDLHDGVRLNMRPFVRAGVLRRAPRLKWTKDPGRDLPSAPWFHVFRGDRDNEYSIPLALKRT